MKTHGFEKLYVARNGTTWLKVFLFGYLSVFAVALGYTGLSRLIDENVWKEILSFFSGNGVNYEAVHLIATVLLFLSGVLALSFLPLINKAGYRSVMAHLAMLVLYRPCLWIASAIFHDRMPADLKEGNVFYIFVVVFAVINLVYFARRKYLFADEIGKLVTDKEKDEIKPRYT